MGDTRTDAIYRQYADACDDADWAFVSGLITVQEKMQAVLLARIIRDIALKATGTAP